MLRTDHVVTISIVNIEIKAAIRKANISDHFPILFVAKTNPDASNKAKQHILKCHICYQSIKKFKLRDATWDK